MAFLAAGGGGFSASSSTGPQTSRGGDIGGASINFGGITTGAKTPPWVILGGLALLVVGAYFVLRRK